MHYMRRLLMVVLVLAVCLTVTNPTLAQDSRQTTHTVQAGETLFRIATQYNTTVAAIAQANNITNSNLIFVGQVLQIPVQQAQETPVPTGTVTAETTTTPDLTTTPAVTVAPPLTFTPASTAGPALTPTPATAIPAATGDIIHVVQPGENLFRISLKYNLLAAIVAAYNGIPNPNLIYVGQRIRIPTYGGVVTAQGTLVPQVTPVSTAVSTAVITPGAITPVPSGASNVGFAYGVQIHLPNQDMNTVLTSASDLGVTWAKQQIEWALYEPSAGNINWDPIDEMVNAMDAAGLNILLTITAAPGWARDTDQESGPPTDYQTYANFVGAMAERYAGQVDAYEIWNEQNLRREWNTPRGISAASYVELLRLAYNAIKVADPEAVVVAGALSPTGVNDGVTAIDDRAYLRQMYAAGVTQWADAIGAHPNGWANPPDSVCCQTNRPAVAGWDEHPSFFFKQTLQDYREIMMQNGDSGTFIWPTEFGWGSNDGLNVEPGRDFSADLAFVEFTNLDEQAQYIVRGYQLGRELGYVGPMFLWNLNFCPVVGVTGEQCLWSLLDPAGNPRPAYLAVRDMTK